MGDQEISDNGGNASDEKDLPKNSAIKFDDSIIDKRYTINLSTPLPDHDTLFAKAYSVADSADSGASLYAMLFEKDFALNLAAIHSLKKLNHPNIQNIIDAGKYILGTTKAERFAVILKNITLPTLDDYIKETGAMPILIVTDTILPQLAGAVNELSENEIVHGNINLSSIYYEEKSGMVFLKECVSSYCGFQQLPEFENINSMLCSPEGKGAKDYGRDPYAIGMTIATLMLGKSLFEGMKAHEIIGFRLEKGSTDLITEKFEQNDISITLRTLNLIKSLCIDSDEDRWKIKDIMNWVGKKDSAVPVFRHRTATTPFTFNEQEYYNIKHLAHDLFLHWDSTKRLLHLEELERWVSLSIKRPDISERLGIIGNSLRGNIILPDHVITRLINLIDSDGPIRFKDLSLNIFGIGTALAYANSTGDEDKTKNCLSYFTEDLAENWIRAQSTPANYSQTYLNWQPSTVMQYLRSKSLGFGFERILYELNPYLPCQGNVIGGKFATELHDVLDYLDNIATKKETLETEPIDKHSAAFIARKIHLSNEIRIRAIHKYPYVSKNEHIIMLALLTVAQTEGNPRKLVNLALWLRYRLKSLLDELYSDYIRKELGSNMEKAAKTGDLRKMYKLLAEGDYIKHDSFGFMEAKRRYLGAQVKIYSLRLDKGREILAYQYGLRIGLASSYLILVCTGLLMLFKHI